MQSHLVPGIIDADSHLTEPADLWSQRLPAKWRDVMPRVELEAATGIERWRIGETWCAGVGTQSQNGWGELPPSFPPTWEQIDPSCYDVEQRLGWMDRQGLHAQVLYPNVVTFEGYAIKALADRDLQIAIYQAYNDYVHEFATSAPGRFVPVAAVPFWDVEATVAEMRRCAEKGFTAVVWAATMERHGLPPIGDEHWYPVYEAAQSLELSINFHVGVGSTSEEIASFRELKDGKFDFGQWAAGSTNAYMANGMTMTKLIMSGVCHRFPRLNFVSVESGFGFVPYMLEALDWQWTTIGAPKQHPDWLMPSEYFRRQMFCSFWFESAAFPLLAGFQDNVMFETDFPHSTALTSDGVSLVPAAREIIERDAHLLDAVTLQKVLSTNARTLYRL